MRDLPLPAWLHLYRLGSARAVNGFGAQSYLPDHVLTLTGGLRFFDQKLTVGTRVFIASEAFVGLVNNPTDPYTDGYTLVDLFSSYKFDSGLELGATVTNLFDVTYTPATSTPPSSSCGSFIPGACPPGPDTGRGRTFLLTAQGAVLRRLVRRQT